MKRSLMILLPALAIMVSCGSLSQYASEQRFPDGIYFRPQPVIELLTAEDFRARAAENLAADSLRLKNKLKSQERNDYDYNYYGYYGPFGLYGTYGYPYYYYPWSYYSRAYYGLGYPWSLSSYYAWSSLYDPLWDPTWTWGYGFGHGYGYYGGYWHGPYHTFVPSESVSYISDGYANNHRRAGSMGTGVSTSSYRGAPSSGAREVNPTRSGGGSSGAYRRSGGITISADHGSYSGSPSTGYTASSSSRSYSSSSSSYSSSSSSHSSGGGSYSGGGGSSHSGGSGGGGGGRR